MHPQCLMLSLSISAQEWGTVFPTEKEMAELDKNSSSRIIVQNSYYPKSGKFDDVLALRIAASKLLKEFGFSSGKVLVHRQTIDSLKGKEEVASVVWLCEYESLESLKKEMNSWNPAQENRFQKEILNKMKLLIDRFKRTSSYVVD